MLIFLGTTERICLITGTVASILTVLDFIFEKMQEYSDTDTKGSSEREKQLKILVPNSTASKVIGKAGTYIKQIKEESGCFIQLSQKPTDLSLQERCITIIGKKENNKIACKMVLAKIAEDPSSGTCTNLSYADVSGPAASLSSSINNKNTSQAVSTNGVGINLTLNIGSNVKSSNTSLNTNVLDRIKVN